MRMTKTASRRRTSDPHELLDMLLAASAINQEGNHTRTNIIEIEQQIEHGQEILRTLIKRRDILELKLAQQGSYTPPDVLFEIEDINKQINDTKAKLAQLEINAKQANNQIIPTELNNNPTEMFIPQWSVLRSQIQYVDANIALRFADAAQDLSIMLSFLTLFMGSAISFAISWATTDKIEQTTLFMTATMFCLLSSIIFSILSFRAWSRAEKTKKQILERNELSSLPNHTSENNP